jgi:hypothetical protein
MNELERLIAALPRPEPSEELDHRIDALLAHQPVRAPIRRWSGTMSWIATAACVGGLGFFLGRQSVVVGPVPTAVPPWHRRPIRRRKRLLLPPT